MTEKEMVNTIAKKLDEVLRRLRISQKTKIDHEDNDRAAIKAFDKLIRTIEGVKHRIYIDPDLPLEVIVHMLQELRYYVNLFIQKGIKRKKPVTTVQSYFDIKIDNCDTLNDVDSCGINVMAIIIECLNMIDKNSNIHFNTLDEVESTQFEFDF